MAINLDGIVDWLNGWFPLRGTETRSLSEVVSALSTSIEGKVSVAQNDANKNMVTNSSGSVVTQAIDSSPTQNSDNMVKSSGVYTALSSKIDTAGTGLSKSGTTLNHNDNVTSAQSTPVFKKFSYDKQGHITGTANVTASDLPNIDATNVSYNDTYASGINTVDDALYDLDDRINNLSCINAIQVVSTLPTASASTMGKLYIISENSKINVYYTVDDGTGYNWHEMDTDILDDLSIGWSDVQNNPFANTTPSSFSSSSHIHGNITSDGKIGTSASKIITTGTGGVLQASSSIPVARVSDSNAHVNIGTSANALQSAINTGIDTVIGGLKTDKQDEITSIVLVPKATDSSGKIIFYTGDEPT